MLHGPLKLEASLLEFVSKKIADGVTAENSHMLESDIIHRLDEIIADNSQANDTALPLAQNLTMGKQNISLLQLASMQGWERLIDKIILLAKEKKIAINFQAQNEHGKIAFDYAQEYQHDSIAKKLDMLRSQNFIAPEDVADLDFIAPAKRSPKIKRTLHDLIIYSTHQSKADMHTFMTQIEVLGNIEKDPLPPAPPVKFLCAQGGGAKGAAYTGTVLAMDQTGTLSQLKTVGGASAGAINAFILGLGLDAQELDLLMRNLNLLDLNDYSDSYATKLHSALNHSGKNFHNWASMMMELVAGNPNITFREYRELCKTNPNLKEMVFKGTMLKPEVKEFTFSADDTPDVVIVDAVRASMSFPGAFEPWEVKIKLADDNLKTFGTFTDGGVLNNYPITVFNDKSYEDPNYPREDTPLSSQADKIARNPCSVGLALCSKLLKLNKNITPFTPRIDGLLLDKRLAAQEHKDETIESELQNSGWHFHQLAHAIVKHKLGLNPEDQYAKYKAYSDQTVQIYTEGVDTLEFSLSPEKQRIIEASGYNAWMQWFKTRQNPAKTYPLAKFRGVFLPKDAMGELLDLPSDNDFVTHFEKVFKEYMLIIIEESLACQHNPLNEFKDPYKNQRLKFYSNLILKGIEIYKHKKIQTPVETLLENAFASAVRENAQKQAKRVEHRDVINSIIEESTFLPQLSKLISSDQKKDREKALRLFKGKLSYIFKYMEQTKAGLLCQAVASGDPVLLKGMLDQLRLTDQMLSQTKRPLRYSLDDLLNDTNNSSLYQFAMGHHSGLIIPVLLEAKVDPLKTDFYGKNAFHYAIDAGDFEALEVLAKYCVEKNIHFESIIFSPIGDTIGHYLIRKASNSLLSSLKEKPAVLSALFSDKILNDDGVTCLQLAAHLFYHDDEHEHNKDELKDTNSLAFNRIICASKGILGQGEILALVNIQNDAHNKNKEKKAKSNHALQTLKSTLIQIASDETALNQVVGNLSLEQCMGLLQSSFDSDVNFLIECAQVPAYAHIAKCLFTKISELTYSKFQNTPSYLQFLELLNTKYRHMSPLYVAAIADNPVMIDALRTYDVPVSNAGPIDNPNALTAAASNSSLKAVEQIILTKPKFNPGYYENIERRLGDLNGRNVMHFLAMTPSSATISPIDVAKAMERTLSVGLADFHSISSITDVQGNSPFFYLLNNKDAATILEYVCKELKKAPHEIFDLNAIRSNGYSDLEWAFKTKPLIAETIASLTPKVSGKESKLILDARLKIEAEMHADIMHLSANEYQAIKEERAKPQVRIFENLEDLKIIEDYEPDNKDMARPIAFIPWAKAKAQNQLINAIVGQPSPVDDKDAKPPVDKAKL